MEYKGLVKLDNYFDIYKGSMPKAEIAACNEVFSIFDTEESQEFCFEDSVAIFKAEKEFDKDFSYGRKLNTIRALSEGSCRDLSLDPKPTVLLATMQNPPPNWMRGWGGVVLEGSNDVLFRIWDDGFTPASYMKKWVPHELRHIYQNQQYWPRVTQLRESDAIEYSMLFLKKYFQQYLNMPDHAIKSSAISEAKMLYGADQEYDYN
ncbi:MAG: hypothetical protein FWE16_04380 [Firmicutes bacterium]|nr:hypothetical protein [Bacillota bacterium]